MAEKLRVAIFGSSGQLGTDLVDVLGASDSFVVVPITHDDADCTDPAAVRKVLFAARPQIVINSAAFVRVDDCEDQLDEAFRVNAIGAFHIARTCAEIEALCVYISTDYVFDGTKKSAYTESDFPNPINVYGASKLAGEHLVKQTVPRWLIVRVGGLFGRTRARGKGGNFIETILAKVKTGESLRVVDDIRVSPTYTRDAAAMVSRSLENKVTGIIHATNSGSCTWYEFAKAVLNLCGINLDIQPVLSSEYPARAKRPQNSALTTERRGMFHDCGMPTWQQGLKNYLVETSSGYNPRSEELGL